MGSPQGWWWCAPGAHIGPQAQHTHRYAFYAHAHVLRLTHTLIRHMCTLRRISKHTHQMHTHPDSCPDTAHAHHPETRTARPCWHIPQTHSCPRCPTPCTCQAPFFRRRTFFHSLSSPRGGYFVVSILQVRKLRHREGPVCCKA